MPLNRKVATLCAMPVAKFNHPHHTRAIPGGGAPVSCKLASTVGRCMRHLPILSDPHGARSLKSSRQLELYQLGCRVSSGVQPQEMAQAPVFLAEYGAEEQKQGTGGRGGAHLVRLSELPMKFLPNRLFASAPIKRKIDGGEAMKDTWATEKRSRRTGVAMKVDAQGHKHSRICSVT